MAETIGNALNKCGGCVGHVRANEKPQPYQQRVRGRAGKNSREGRAFLY